MGVAGDGVRSSQVASFSQPSSLLPLQPASWLRDPSGVHSVVSSAALAAGCARASGTGASSVSFAVEALRAALHYRASAFVSTLEVLLQSACWVQ